MDIKELEKLMLETGAVIRAIPHERVEIYAERHKKDHPDGTVFYDEVRKCNMLKVIEKNSKGGKFVVTREKGQGTIINNWGKPVVFYDTLEEAIGSLTENKKIKP